MLDAVCVHYELDRNLMALPTQEKPDKLQPKNRQTGNVKGKKKGEADGKDKE